MSGALESIKAARDQVLSERASADARDSEKYPETIVDAALQNTTVASEPGLFDTLRGFGAAYARTASTVEHMNYMDLDEAMCEYLSDSEYEQNQAHFSALAEVAVNATNPNYVFKGRSRSKLRSGPYEIFSDSDKDLISR